MTLNKKTSFLFLSIIVFIWVLLQLTLAIPESIVNDWMGWRQADTQTIARNFMNEGSNIFYPQINWGGTGPGYVETEFQIYTFIIAKIMQVAGESVLPGQLLSLLFIVVTTIVLYYTLHHQFNSYSAALFGSIIFLISNGPVHLSTSVQPDSLCLLFYSLSLFTFLKYLSDNKDKFLWLTVLFTIIAGLVKPMALSIGIIQFLLVLFLNRSMLKSIKLWIGWLLVIVFVGSYLLFSYNLYLDYGNTFGVLGGDSKFPTLNGLLVPIHYAKLLYMIVLWGLGPVGFLAIVYLLFKRKLTKTDWALIIGNIAAILIPMRYTVNQGFSPHYYMFAALFGGWLSAKLYDEIIRNQSFKFLKRYIIPVSGVIIVFLYSFHLYSRMHPLKIHLDPEVIRLGTVLTEMVNKDDLVIIRSIADERERSEWGNRINNFEDPRIFYMANVKGWALPLDNKGHSLIEEYFNKGAGYYVEPFSRKMDEERYSWLDSHGKVVFDSTIGRIYKLTKPHD